MLEANVMVTNDPPVSDEEEARLQACLELHPHWVDTGNLVMLAHDPIEEINFRRFTTESIEQAAVKLEEQRQRLVAGIIGLEDQRKRLQLCSIQLQECRDETRRRASAFEFLSSRLRS